MPVGEPDGETQTMNIKQTVQDMEKTDDQDELKEMVQTVAWMYNQRLPQLPLLQGFHQAAVSRDEWQMPDKEDDAMDGYLLEKVRLPNFLLRRDKLEAIESEG